MLDSRLNRKPQQDLATKVLANLRGETPLGIEQIDILLRLVSAAAEPLESYLCIGPDLAMLAWAISEENPAARGMLAASSTEELQQAHLQLQARGKRNEVNLSLLPHRGRLALIGEEEYSAIICGSTAERLGCPRRELFRECYDLLKPGGLLINVETVASATRWTESAMDDYLIDAIFGEELRHGVGKSRAEIAREHFERTAAGSEWGPVPLEVQFDWLREIGFESVDCYSKVSELAIFGGQRPQ